MHNLKGQKVIEAAQRLDSRNQALERENELLRSQMQQLGGSLPASKPVALSQVDTEASMKKVELAAQFNRQLMITGMVMVTLLIIATLSKALGSKFE